MVDSVSNKQNIKNKDPSSYTSEISTVAKLTISPLTHAIVPLVLIPKRDYTPPPRVAAIAHIFKKKLSLLNNSPDLVQIDGIGKIFLKVCNISPTPITISKREQAGLLKLYPRKKFLN